MNEIETYDDCTCNSRGCYECRRHEIDETAEKIHDREVRICTGMAGFNIEDHAWKMANQYRCEQINKLAFEFAN
jgi:hypothetical protein